MRSFERKLDSRQPKPPLIRSWLKPALRAKATAPPIVHEVLRSPGRRLDEATRADFEGHFGHDLSQIEIHTGVKAASSAEAVNALAYAVGNHVVLGRGYGLSRRQKDRHLLAHELVHTMQWAAGPIPSRLPIAPADSPAEREADAHTRTPNASTAALYRQVRFRSVHDVDGMPPTSRPLGGWASDYGGIPIRRDKMRVTSKELKEIYPQLARDAKANPPRVTESQIESFASYLSEAFLLMRLDTVQAQAAYLAHGAVESDQFRKFTETQSWKQWYEEDPTSIRLDTGYLSGLGSQPRYRDYKMGGTINPYRDPSWQRTYIGRGPVQVTHKRGYAQTLEQMRQMADEYDSVGQSASASRLREAIAAIEADPRQAANPRYTFLFSAAYEKWTGGERLVAKVGRKAPFTGSGPESKWVTSGAREETWKAERKAAAWERAYDVLSRKAAPPPDKDPSTYRGPAYARSSHRIPA